VSEITYPFASSFWSDLSTIPQSKNTLNRRAIPRIFLNWNVAISTQAEGHVSKLFRARFIEFILFTLCKKPLRVIGVLYFLGGKIILFLIYCNKFQSFFFLKNLKELRPNRNYEMFFDLGLFHNWVYPFILQLLSNPAACLIVQTRFPVLCLCSSEL